MSITRWKTGKKRENAKYKGLGIPLETSNVYWATTLKRALVDTIYIRFPTILPYTYYILHHLFIMSPRCPDPKAVHGILADMDPEKAKTSNHKELDCHPLEDPDAELSEEERAKIVSLFFLLISSLVGRVSSTAGSLVLYLSRARTYSVLVHVWPLPYRH